MMEGQFDVVFRGQTIKNIPLPEVKTNLVRLFKSSPVAVEKLFNNGEVAIKKSLDYTTAMKYLSALKKAGALALIKEVETLAETTPTAKSQGRASFGTTEQTQKTPEVAQASKPAEKTVTKSNDSDKTIDSTTGNSNSANVSTTEPDLMTIANVGASLLPAKVYEKRDVDTSDLSLAAAGERLLPKTAPESHPQPSIDHLSLE